MNPTPDIRAAAGALDCQAFLASHSEYVDERLDAGTAARFDAHREQCAACARYDDVVRRGARLLGLAEVVEVSQGFDDRLKHRLLHVADEQRAARAGSGATLTSSLAIAAVLTAVAWSPVLGPALRPAAEEPFGMDRHPVTRSLLTAPEVNTAATPAPLFVPVGDDYLAAPGPYSPLLIKSPAMRLVSTGAVGTPQESRPVD